MAFMKMADYRWHMKVTHGGGKANALVSSSTASDTGDTVHTQVQRGDDETSADKRVSSDTVATNTQYKCKHCDRSFDALRRLKKHSMSVHMMAI
jgi:hypothetical protein